MTYDSTATAGGAGRGCSTVIIPSTWPSINLAPRHVGGGAWYTMVHPTPSPPLPRSRFEIHKFNKNPPPAPRPSHRLLELLGRTHSADTGDCGIVIPTRESFKPRKMCTFHPGVSCSVLFLLRVWAVSFIRGQDWEVQPEGGILLRILTVLTQRWGFKYYWYLLQIFICVGFQLFSESI